jgi:hypothetical protein
MFISSVSVALKVSLVLSELTASAKGGMVSLMEFEIVVNNALKINNIKLNN